MCEFTVRIFVAGSIKLQICWVGLQNSMETKPKYSVSFIGSLDSPLLTSAFEKIEIN